MSTPIEIYDADTHDSVFVDEYGLISVSVINDSDPSLYFAEMTVETAQALISQLQYAVGEALAKRGYNNEGHLV